MNKRNDYTVEWESYLIATGPLIVELKHLAHVFLEPNKLHTDRIRYLRLSILLSGYQHDWK